MDILKRAVGVFLIVVGVVVALHTIVEPLYHTTSDAQPYAPLWNILDPIMAVAIVLTVIFAYIRKRDVDGEGGATITREFLTANTIFYGILFVGIMFFWNWFNNLSSAFNAVGSDTVSMTWIIIDAALPLLLGAMGISMLKAEDA